MALVTSQPTTVGAGHAAFLTTLARPLITAGTLHPAWALCIPELITMAGGQSVLTGKVWVTFISPKLGSRVSPTYPTRRGCVAGRGYLHMGRAAGVFL